MSDYEKINQRVATMRAEQRKAAVKRLIRLLIIVLIVVLSFLGLEYIGFISELFMVILIAIAVCVGSFRAGCIWCSFPQ